MSNIKVYLKKTVKHPLGALYGTLLGIVAFSAALPMVKNGMWEQALVGLLMAGFLIALMLKSFVSTFRKESSSAEKAAAWFLVIFANISALVPAQDFPGSIGTAFAFSLLICAAVLYFSGGLMAGICIAPALWCCVFLPFHGEFMLLLSFPLRLSATMLSAGILSVCGTEVVYSGTSLALPGLNIAITDACSGINQLDAFILLAFIVVEIMHKKIVWKLLHFAFIMPSIIIGNSLRIVFTVLLYKVLGESVLQNTWHVGLGYVQIALAMLIFIAVGKIFAVPDGKAAEEKQ